jgi:hypothetical protein
MALEAIINKPGACRVVLEEYPEGVYVLVYETSESQWPYRDNLQNDWAMAKRSALHRHGIIEEMWREIPDTKFNG